MIITFSDLIIAETCACFRLISEAHKIITVFEGLTGLVRSTGNVLCILDSQFIFNYSFLFL